MPNRLISFCCLVGRGLRVDSETSSMGGGMGATGAHLWSSRRKKFVSSDRRISAPSILRR